MEGFEGGSYISSKKLERKPESNLEQSSFLQLQSFSQSQQPGEEQKQVQKTTHAITPTSQEKLRKQMNSALHQEVSEFNPSSQMSMEQLIKVVLNPQEEVKKLKKDNDKLMENSEQARENRIKTHVLGERSKRFLKHISESEQLIPESRLKIQRNQLAKLVENQQTLQKQIESRNWKQEQDQNQRNQS